MNKIQRTLFAAMVSVMFIFAAGSASAQSVYVCKTKGATVYHKTQTCSALKTCKGGVDNVKVGQAKQAKKRQCKKCFETAKKSPAKNKKATNTKSADKSKKLEKTKGKSTDKTEPTVDKKAKKNKSKAATKTVK